MNFEVSQVTGEDVNLPTGDATSSAHEGFPAPGVKSVEAASNVVAGREIRSSMEPLGASVSDILIGSVR